MNLQIQVKNVIMFMPLAVFEIEGFYMHKCNLSLCMLNFACVCKISCFTAHFQRKIVIVRCNCNFYFLIRPLARNWILVLYHKFVHRIIHF